MTALKPKTRRSLHPKKRGCQGEIMDHWLVEGTSSQDSNTSLSFETKMAILFRKTISVLVISQLVFPPSLLMAMDSGRDDGASANRRVSQLVSPAAAAPVTTTAPDIRAVNAIGTIPPSGQASEASQTDNSGIELSSVPLFVSGPSGAISRKNLGDSHASSMTLAVLCSPPRPSVSVDHGSERSHADIAMDSTSSIKQQSRNQVSFSMSASSHPLILNRSSYPSSPSNQVTRAVVCPPPGNQNHGSIAEDPLDVFLNPLDMPTTGAQGHEEFSKVSGVPHGHRPFDTTLLSPAVTSFLNAMGWTIKDLQAHGISIAVLDKILPIETRIMPNFLRWASIDRWGARLFHLPLLDFGGLGHSAEGLKLQGKRSWSRFWLQGRSLPLKSGCTLRKALASDALREGLEFGVAKGLNLTLAAILMYQITQPSDNIIAVYQSSSTNSILALSDYFKNNPAIFSVFAFPPVYGLLKAVSSLRAIDAALTFKDIKEAEEIFDHLPPTFWNTYLRGLLPFHPLRSSLQKFEQRLAWEGRQGKCGQQEREAAYQLIEKVARQGKGFTQTEGFYGLARLAYGLNLKDLPKLRGAQDNSSLLHRLSLKTRAFESLVTFHPDSRLTKLYQDYYLWGLGHSPSFWKTSIPMATMKAVRLTTQAFSLWAICKAISDYFNCPDKPGLSFTGYQPWSSSYSQSCFDELVRQFNVIPGQPANTLIEVIPQYHFSDKTYNLDLSGKGIEADVLVEIIQGFQRQYQQGKAPLLTALNLGGNNLGNPEALTQVLSILPHTVKTLGLSSINTYGTTAWELAMAQSLSLIPFVTDLDLSVNSIGWAGDAGTVALGQSLGNLTALQSLNLGTNDIGLIGDAGTVALGQGLGNLTALQSLNLGTNFIGWTGSSAGTMALGQGLSYLNRLTSFNLFHNPIAEGVAAVVQGLRNNTNLKFLDLSYIGIGIIEQDVAVLADVLSSLSSLQTFSILPCYLTPTTAQTLNRALALNPNIAPIPIPLTDPEAMRTFFQTIPLDTTTINLSKRVGGAGDNANTITALMQSLANYPYLTSLDLSYNMLGYFNSLGIIALGQGLKNLTSLTSLDLSYNLIGARDTLGEETIAHGIARLVKLSYLNLGYNTIGYTGDAGTVALGQSLGNLTALQSLNLGPNFISYTGDAGTVALGQGLGNLTALQSLNLGHGAIGNTGDAGTVALGQGLGYLPLLTNLDLSFNYVGLTSDQGTQIIGHSLDKLTKLNTLNLASNYIGTTGKNGSFSILTALPQLSNLETIDLAGMQNVSWTQGAQALSSFTNKKLLAACESQLCHGTAVTPVNQRTTPPVTSSAIRLQAPLPFRLMNNAVEGVGRFLFNTWNSLMDSVTENIKEVTADSPSYFPNINHSYISDWQPNPFTKIGQQSVDYATLAPYVLQQSTGGYSTYLSLSN